MKLPNVLLFAAAAADSEELSSILRSLDGSLLPSAVGSAVSDSALRNDVDVAAVISALPPASLSPQTRLELAHRCPECAEKVLAPVFASTSGFRELMCVLVDEYRFSSPAVTDVVVSAATRDRVSCSLVEKFLRFPDRVEGRSANDVAPRWVLDLFDERVAEALRDGVQLSVSLSMLARTVADDDVFSVAAERFRGRVWSAAYTVWSSSGDAEAVVERLLDGPVLSADVFASLVLNVFCEVPWVIVERFDALSSAAVSLYGLQVLDTGSFSEVAVAVPACRRVAELVVDELSVAGASSFTGVVDRSVAMVADAGADCDQDLLTAMAVFTAAASPLVPVGAVASLVEQSWSAGVPWLAVAGLTRRRGVDPEEFFAAVRQLVPYTALPYATTSWFDGVCAQPLPAAWVNRSSDAEDVPRRLDWLMRNGFLDDEMISHLRASKVFAAGLVFDPSAPASTAIGRWLLDRVGPHRLLLVSELAGSLTLGDLVEQLRVLS